MEDGKNMSHWKLQMFFQEQKNNHQRLHIHVNNITPGASRLVILDQAKIFNRWRSIVDGWGTMVLIRDNRSHLLGQLSAGNGFWPKLVRF